MSNAADTFNAIIILIAFVSSLGFLVNYGLTAKWWINPFGLYIFLQQAGVVLILIKSVLTVVQGRPLNTSFVNLLINGFVATLFVSLWVTYGRVRRITKRGLAAKREFEAQAKAVESTPKEVR